jgi:hypothetical protein
MGTSTTLSTSSDTDKHSFSPLPETASPYTIMNTTFLPSKLHECDSACIVLAATQSLFKPNTKHIVISYKWDPGNYQGCRYFYEALGKIQIWEIMPLAHGLVGSFLHCMSWHEGSSQSLDKIGYDFTSFHEGSSLHMMSIHAMKECQWIPFASINDSHEGGIPTRLTTNADPRSM